ncbi:BamA/TamA family outer membrane protein [Pseudodonghicola xiamenensis]|uniref:Bacterial surface antigen (D15) domain-containing protein n=1 Tax=Pseudodonghicola xiamenensis TaxID=337702 RepID=A0A8J3H9X8_9RHOB|nr:BamA/TamA family outer membrane protein [Pseudodonghicola xiamenensis]GHG93847.1 hypothetical protein GCM10010961_26600 [Pseudodonghicola xiamenensis]
MKKDWTIEMKWETRAAMRGTFFSLILGAVPSVALAGKYAQVEVRGNEFLRSEDILAACEISSDDNFTSIEMAAIHECLMSTGQFGSVLFAPRGDTMTIVVNELNSRPGRVEIGVEIDSEDGLIGSLYFERFNLFPKTFGSFELRGSREASSLRMGLYRKDVFPGGWDMGLDAGAVNERYDDLAYDHRRAYLEPFIAQSFDTGERVEFGLGYRSDAIRNVDVGASPLIKADSGSQRAAYVRMSYAYRQENWSFKAQQFFFGLGTGDVVSRSHADISGRLGLLPEKLDLVLRLEGGHVTEVKGDAARISDRFVSSGATLRGFASRGIGPRDSGDFLGGENYLVGSAELRRDIGTLFGTGASVGGFVDVGSVWGLSDTLGGSVDDSLNWRASVGLALTLNVGNLPVSVFVADPIRKEEGDKEQNFGLSVSARF